jgi:hypothetical protein
MGSQLNVLRNFGARTRLGLHPGSYYLNQQLKCQFRSGIIIHIVDNELEMLELSSGYWNMTIHQMSLPGGVID